MNLSSLTAISPLDGRYADKTQALRPLFSEYGLIYYRLHVEIHWLITLTEHTEAHIADPLKPEAQEYLLNILRQFNEHEAQAVKKIENTTNHDVKAVEYYLQQKLQKHAQLKALIPLIHFGCTSEDINNLAYALMLSKAREELLLPTMQKLIHSLQEHAKSYAKVPMLARTHGQPATPTTVGKEIANFIHRLEQPLKALTDLKIQGKFNGAVGNYNAHLVAYPHVNWLAISEQFVTRLGLDWNNYTTQIEPHDNLAEFLHALIRFNNIVIALDRDFWGYISIGHFIQRQVKTEVGSSTMPHKINPIDFENSEGNLGLCNAIADHLANKLPISRWQRDLTDSTVLRNVGVVFGYALLAYRATLKGLTKISANEKHLATELNMHYEVLAEAVQTVMRRYGIADAYEQLKEFSRGNPMTKDLMHKFIDQITIPTEEETRLKALTPATYIGYAATLAERKL